MGKILPQLITGCIADGANWNPTLKKNPIPNHS